MNEPMFYRFACAQAHGYPKIRSMTTLRPAGEAGESKEARQKYFDEITRMMIRGEKIKIESVPLDIPLITIEEKGSKWPDIIGHGRAGYHFIFTERVIEAMDKEGITGFTARPILIDHISSKKLREKEHPNYYCIDVAGSIQIVKKYYDKVDSGYAYVGEVTNGEDQTYHLPNMTRTARFVPIEDSWDGSDWFCMSNHGHFRHYCCSRKLVGLAFREKWTNCQIAPMDQIIADRGIDIPLPAKGKLPSIWYSEHHAYH
ncbi:MAG: hypothetical protein V4727_05420 [Verrucomicrobiota bacterium]